VAYWLLSGHHKLEELQHHASLVERYRAWKKDRGMCDEGDGEHLDQSIRQ
jgi:hypothetical protein